MTKRKIGLILLFLLLSSHNAVYTQESAQEYDLKATMMTKIPLHIDWPENSDVNNGSKPFVIAVIGENPFGSALDAVREKSEIKKKKVEIHHISQAEEIAESGCNLLYISKTSKKKLAEIISYTEGKPILTISDSKGFAEMGVHINFYIKSSKLTFEVNRQAVRESGLVINYHLLKLAGRIINR